MSENNALSNAQKLDLAKYVIKHFSEQIKFADQKALVLLAVIGFLAGNLLVKVVELQKAKLLCGLPLVVSVLAVLATFVCLIFSLKVVYPRLRRSQAKASFGIIYWGDVLSYPSLEKFQESFHQLDEEKLLENFSAEIYSVSTINSRKYATLQKSFLMAALSALFSVVLFLFF